MSLLRAASFLVPPLLGLVVMGCGSSSGGGGGGASTAAPVASGSQAQTTSSTGTTTTTPTTPTTSTQPTTPATTTPPSGNAPIPTTSEDRYYNPQVRSVLLTYCTSCHASTANPAYASYALSGFPTDPMSFDNTKARTNDLDPEGSLLLRKAINAEPHGGGKVLDRSDAGYEWIVNWIRQGRRLDEFENAPRTFARDVQPILDRNGCFGCHSGGAGGFTVGTNLMTNYNQMIATTDPNNPANSFVIRKNDGALNHAGAASWAVGRPERDVIIEWIQDGRLYAR